MDFGNTKYYNQKKRVITLRKGRGTQAGYVTMSGAKIVSRRPTVYYIMNNGAIRALSNANTGKIPTALKYKVLKGKAPKKPKNVGNAAALNAAKPKRKYTRKAGAFPLKPRASVLAKARANTIYNKRVAALTKARAAKKMHSKNLPGFYNNSGNLFGPTKANRPKHDPRTNWNLPNPGNLNAKNNGANWNLPNPGNLNAKNTAANNAANSTANKLNKVAGVTNTTANAAANAAAAAAKAVTPANAGNAKVNNIANAAAAGATAAVQALPVNQRNNKNAVAAAAAAGASQAANAAQNGNSTPTESKNIGAAAGTAVSNAGHLKVN
jgi:hypothetical protein